MIIALVVAVLIGVAVGITIADSIRIKVFDEAIKAWEDYIKLLDTHAKVIRWINELPVPYSDEAFLKHYRVLVNDILESKDEEEAETCSSG
jgi:hypothetical protein